MSLIARRHRFRPAALLASIALASGLSLPAGVATADENANSKRILVLPALQWNASVTVWHYAAGQTATDLARLMGNLNFGLLPQEVNQLLPHPLPSLHWADMPVAPEYPEEVRYIWMPLAISGPMRAAIKSCFGESSYVVLLFRSLGLFRISWRLLPDQSCPNPVNAANELFATFVPIDSQVAVSTHYQAGYAEVVDVSDPNAGVLVNERWQMRGQ